MESVPFTYKVYDNILEIIPNEPILDNSVYTIHIKKIKSADGKSSLSDLKIEHTTAMTPCYCSVTPIQLLVDVFDIPEKTLWFFIRQASRKADYINGGPVDTTNGVPYVVEQFTEVAATILALTKAYIVGSNDAGLEGTVGNVTFKNGETVGDINKLLENLRKFEHMWAEAIRGYEFEGRNHIATARRGDYAPSYELIPVTTLLQDFTRNRNYPHSYPRSGDLLHMRRHSYVYK